METQGHIKRVFPGGNTSEGFYSFYEYIIPIDARRIFIIKGGPGVGKSSFMKGIAAKMAELGYNIEMHHCSSDNNSIDGVVVPELAIALIDGTAPHILDPRNPGCVDEILHFGDFWDEKAMMKNKEAILACNKEVARLFKQAYRMLKAAAIVKGGIASMYEEAANKGFNNKETAKLMREIFGDLKCADTPGNIRRLFASAITPDGFVNYLDTILGHAQRVYVVKGRPGTGKSYLLRKIAKTALEYGLSTEVYHCSLTPDRIEHLYIPGLSVAVTTPLTPAKVDLSLYNTVDLDCGLNQELVSRYRESIHKQQSLLYNLLDSAVAYIKQAKEMHDIMEGYYIPNMDFSAVKNLQEKTLGRILAYAKK